MHLIEQYKLELKILPEYYNGFEFLCHPELENPESLAQFIDN